MANFLLSVKIIPPLPDVMILFPLNDKQPNLPIVPVCFPLNLPNL